MPILPFGVNWMFLGVVHDAWPIPIQDQIPQIAAWFFFDNFVLLLLWQDYSWSFLLVGCLKPKHCALFQIIELAIIGRID
jgi:hypothetical protein